MRIIEEIPPTTIEDRQPVISQGRQTGSRIIEEESAFAKAEEPGFFSQAADKALSFGERALSLLTGAGAEVAGGFGAIAKSITSGTEEGEKTLNAITEALTFEPRSPQAKKDSAEFQESLQKAVVFAEENKMPIVSPVLDVLLKLGPTLGDFGAEQARFFGSPTLEAFAGAFGATLPAATLELLGLKGVGKLSRKIGDVKKGLREGEILEGINKSAPTPEKLKEVASGVFNEVRDIGATVNPKAYGNLVDNVAKDLKARGFRERINPDVAAVLDEMNLKRGIDLNLDDLTDLREVAQGLADSIDKKTKSLGLSIMDNIDAALDAPGVLKLPPGADKNVGKAFATARKFWGQARRSEKITQLQELAEGNRASFLQGVQTEFKALIRQNIKGKGDGKYFSREEIRLMDEVIKNKKGVNILKNLAKLQVTRSGGGSLIPLLGPGAAGIGLLTGTTTAATGAGALVVFPIIGEVSNTLAVKLTKSNLKMANQIVRAGADGRKIARAYFENVPKKQRTTDELAELLVSPDLDVSKLPKTKFTEEAIRKANAIRAERLALAAQVPAAGLEKEEAPQ